MGIRLGNQLSRRDGGSDLDLAWADRGVFAALIRAAGPSAAWASRGHAGPEVCSVAVIYKPRAPYIFQDSRGG